MNSLKFTFITIHFILSYKYYGGILNYDFNVQISYFITNITYF